MAVVLCGWCLTLRLGRHFPPRTLSTNHVAPFQGTRGCRWDKKKLKIESLHSFFLFTACRGGGGDVFFFGAAVCRWMEDVFIINRLFPITNQCSLRHVTFSGVLSPSGCVTLKSISQNTLVKKQELLWNGWIKPTDVEMKIKATDTSYGFDQVKPATIATTTTDGRFPRGTDAEVFRLQTWNF